MVYLLWSTIRGPGIIINDNSWKRGSDRENCRTHTNVSSNLNIAWQFWQAIATYGRTNSMAGACQYWTDCTRHYRLSCTKQGTRCVCLIITISPQWKLVSTANHAARLVCCHCRCYTRSQLFFRDSPFKLTDRPRATTEWWMDLQWIIS